MNNALKIALVTEEAAGIRLLRALGASSHQLCYVFCAPPTETETGPSVWTVAQDMGLDTHPVDRLKDPEFIQELRHANIDLLLSVRSPAILSKAVIASPKIGAFNLHTGPLPAYAGRNVISWAIFNGETSHGVTLHQLSEEIDGGDIIYQTRFAIEPDDTALAITGRCIKEGIELVKALIHQAALNPEEIPRHPQDKSGRHYYGKNIPCEGKIDWNQPAKKIHNFIRACGFYPLPSPWGYPEARLGNRLVPLLSAQQTFEPTHAKPGTVQADTDKTILVACADEWLRIKEIMLDGVAQQAHDLLARG